MKIKDGLYHKDIFLPEFHFNSVDVKLDYSPHALNEAEKDRYMVIELPATINLTECEIIEIEVENSQIVKILVRLPYDDEYDLNMPILNANARVKTVWLNCKDDTHDTLDRTKYIGG